MNFAGLIKEVKKNFDYFRYQVSGKHPFAVGYEIAVSRAVDSAMTEGVFAAGVPMPVGYGIGLSERVIEYPWFFSRLPDPPAKILDAGSTLNHDYVLKRLSNYDLSIATLAFENYSNANHPSYVYCDLRETVFRSNLFDMVACLSTLEHVGMDNTMLYTTDQAKKEHDSSAYVEVLEELIRITKPGGRILITVPFGKKRDMGWQQVFDSKMIEHAVSLPGIVQSTVDVYKYSMTGWQQSTVDAASDASYYNIHDKNDVQAIPGLAAAEAVACVHMVKSV